MLTQRVKAKEKDISLWSTYFVLNLNHMKFMSQNRMRSRHHISNYLLCGSSVADSINSAISLL